LEERRIVKALGKFGSSSNLTNVPLTVLQSPPRSASRYDDEQLPEWKKRQLEQEKVEAVRASQEHLRKLEVLKSLSQSELLELNSEAKEVSKSTISYPDVLHPKDDLEMESQELLRLEKILNRHSHNKKNN